DFHVTGVQTCALPIFFDLSLFIEAAIHEVYLTIALTIFLVIAVIWAFLGDWRATMIPAVTIPISLIGSFIVLYALGFSINLVTRSEERRVGKANGVEC